MLITFQILVCSKNISVIVLIQAVIKGEVLLLNVRIEISRMEFDDTSSDSSKCQYITVSLPMKNVNVKRHDLSHFKWHSQENLQRNIS